MHPFTYAELREALEWARMTASFQKMQTTRAMKGSEARREIRHMLATHERVFEALLVERPGIDPPAEWPYSDGGGS